MQNIIYITYLMPIAIAIKYWKIKRKHSSNTLVTYKKQRTEKAEKIYVIVCTPDPLATFLKREGLAGDLYGGGGGGVQFLYEIKTKI